MPRPTLSRGFTLVEVLLVILLIGLLAASVVISFSGDSRDKQLDQQTTQLQQLVHLASETAMLKQQELGLFIDDEGYRFMLFHDNKWHSITSPKALRPRSFPIGFQAELQLEGLEWSEENLLSQIEWQEEDSLFEENSFDELERQKDAADAEKAKRAAQAQQLVGFEIAPRRQGDPRMPQIFILSSGEITPFLLTLSEQSEQPVWQQELSAEFSIPLQRTEVSRDR